MLVIIAVPVNSGRLRYGIFMIVLDMDERIEPRYQSKRTSYMHFSQNEQGWNTFLSI